MQVRNTSTRHPTKKLQPLIDFVASRTKRHARVALYFDDHRSSKRLTTGAAHRGLKGQFLVPPMVRLTLSHGVNRYPRKTTHVKEVGTIVLESWKEEVVLVLAHEFRHIEQFTERKFDPYEAEIDAERFALKILERFRAIRARFATDRA